MKLKLMIAGLCLALSGLQGVAAETTTPAAMNAEPVRQQMPDQQARDFLAKVTEQVILPVYLELDAGAKALTKQSEDFCAAPDADGLKKVRDDWAQTLSVWMQSSPFLFGPAVESEIDFTIYFRPVKKGVIKGLLAAETPLNQQAVEQAGVGGQGLATLEYLLFDRERDDQQLLADFSTTNSRRCAYLVAAAEVLAGNLHTTSHGWNKLEHNYAEAVVTAGAGSTHFTTPYQPIELLINRLYQAVQAIEIKQLGVPLGLRGSRSGTPKAYPYKLEAWRSGYSLANINSALTGVQRTLVDGDILSWLKENEHQELAVQLEQQLNQLLATAWPTRDLFQLLQEKPQAVTPFYEQVQQLSVLVREGLAPALGVQLGFNDNDGD